MTATYPARKTSASQCARLDVVQVLGSANEAVLVEDTKLAQSSVQDTTETSLGCGLSDGAELVALVEEGDDLVALLPLLNLGADLDNLSSTIRSANNGEVGRERVEALNGLAD